jgi:hypothetical protein
VLCRGKNRASPGRQPGCLGSFVASEERVAEEARTRGFATPALVGCAFSETDVTASQATVPSGTAVVKMALGRAQALYLPYTRVLNLGSSSILLNHQGVAVSVVSLRPDRRSGLAAR